MGSKSGLKTVIINRGTKKEKSRRHGGSFGSKILVRVDVPKKVYSEHIIKKEDGTELKEMTETTVSDILLVPIQRPNAMRKIIKRSLLNRAQKKKMLEDLQKKSRVSKKPSFIQKTKTQLNKFFRNKTT